MINTYDQQTGDGQWLRQSLQILHDEIDGVRQLESSMAGKDRRADAARDSVAATQKNMQGRVAG